MEGFIREQTECAVCLDIINEPKSLTCLHTFCSECVYQVTKRRRVTCPICQTVSDDEDIKDDFKVKELLEIRRQNSKISGLTAKQQITDHLKNLQFLKEQYQDRVDHIDVRGTLLKAQLMKQLCSNKRKFIAAFEKQCAAAELEIAESVMDGDVIKRARQTIADIDTYLNDTKYTLKTAAGSATVDVTKRFAQQLANLAERGPPETYVAKYAPLPQFVTFTAAELDEFVGRSFAERKVAFDDVTFVNNDMVDTGPMATTVNSIVSSSRQPRLVFKRRSSAHKKRDDTAAPLGDAPPFRALSSSAAARATAVIDCAPARQARSRSPDDCSSAQSEPPAKR